MKKTLIALLLITMMLFIMTACGGAGGTQATGNSDAAASEDMSDANNGGEDNNTSVDEAAADDSGSASDSGNPAAGNSTGGIYQTPGMELSDYATNFSDTETPYGDSISSMESPDMDALGTSIVVAMPNLELALLGGYDILSTDDLPKEEGKLMLSNMDAVREKSGNKISFSASQIYEEDGTIYKKGDKVTQKGTLDTSSNELAFEDTAERGGKLIERTVMEAVILKDGTYLMQYFKVAENYKEGDPPTVSALFKRFGKDDFIGISAKFDPNYEFKYDSILGKGDIQPDAMAKNYTIDGILTVTGGKVEFKK